MNDPEMCHARIWCRETGVAGGSNGGYEKACRYKHTGGQICNFHKKKGLQLGLITDPRPNTWGDDGNTCPNDKTPGAPIKWKCDPPDYSKTADEHIVNIRDESFGKDLVRAQMNKKIHKMETQIKSMEEKLKKAEHRALKAESLARQMTIAHYDISWRHLAEATDEKVIHDFKILKKDLDTLHRDTNHDECKKLKRQHPRLSNSEFNELAWETYKKPADLVKADVIDEIKISFKQVENRIETGTLNPGSKMIEEPIVCEKCSTTEEGHEDDCDGPFITHYAVNGKMWCCDCIADDCAGYDADEDEVNAVIDDMISKIQKDLGTTTTSKGKRKRVSHYMGKTHRDGKVFYRQYPVV